MSFGRGAVDASVPNTHELDRVMWPLYLRGWSPARRELPVGTASDEADR